MRKIPVGWHYKQDEKGGFDCYFETTEEAWARENEQCERAGMLQTLGLYLTARVFPELWEDWCELRKHEKQEDRSLLFSRGTELWKKAKWRKELVPDLAYLPWDERDWMYLTQALGSRVNHDDVRRAFDHPGCEVLGKFLQDWVVAALERMARAESKKEDERQEVIEQRERATPPFDPESMDWVGSHKKNKEILGYAPGTLAKYRSKSHGGKQLDPYFGVDKDGRRWRRDARGTPKSRVYYYLPDLERYR